MELNRRCRRLRSRGSRGAPRRRGTGSTEESPEYNGPPTGTCRRRRGDEPKTIPPRQPARPDDFDDTRPTRTHQRTDATQEHGVMIHIQYIVTVINRVTNGKETLISCLGCVVTVAMLLSLSRPGLMLTVLTWPNWERSFMWKIMYGHQSGSEHITLRALRGEL